MSKNNVFSGIYFGQDNKESFQKTFSFLKKELNLFKMVDFDKYGKQGVEALRQRTPVDTGKTRDSWYYKIHRREGELEISFHNSNINDGNNIAILLQYGHGTGTGAYVKGKDYINPALRPTFNQIAKEVWKEVTSVE